MARDISPFKIDDQAMRIQFYHNGPSGIKYSELMLIDQPDETRVAGDAQGPTPLGTAAGESQPVTVQHTTQVVAHDIALPIAGPTSKEPSKNPLHRSWSFWYRSAKKAEQHLGSPDPDASWWKPRKLYDFKFAEDFWRLWHNLPRSPSALPAGAGFWFFQTGVVPEWEDPVFISPEGEQTGGEVVFRLSYRSKDSIKNLDKLFCKLVAALVTESMFPPEYVVGVYLEHPPRTTSRRGPTVRLWVRDMGQPENLEQTQEQFAQLIKTHVTQLHVQPFGAKRPRA